VNLPDREVFGVDLAMLVGVCSVVGAALVVAAPWLVPPAALEGVLVLLANEATVVLLAVVAGLLGLRTVYRGEPRSDEAEIELPPPPAERERRREGGVRTAGQSLDELLDRIADPERESRGIDRLIDKGQVRDQVRATAVDVLVDTGGYTPEVAGEHLDRGTWTDRPRAAAFLGDRSLPLEVRIVDWFSGEAFERQVRAAVEELADLAGVETGSGMAPEPVAVEGGVLAGTPWDSTGETAGSAGRPTEDARSAADPGAGTGPEPTAGTAVAGDGGADADGVSPAGIDATGVDAAGSAEETDAPTVTEAERTAAKEGSR